MIPSKLWSISRRATFYFCNDRFIWCYRQKWSVGEFPTRTVCSFWRSRPSYLVIWAAYMLDCEYQALNLDRRTHRPVIFRVYWKMVFSEKLKFGRAQNFTEVSHNRLESLPSTLDIFIDDNLSFQCVSFSLDQKLENFASENGSIWDCRV